ncbi:glycosyltransferase [Candidatus Pelagibacter sp. Uisw_099_02]|uniref:glycosyltransferase n=1 Tax=Candidatus Pelagibacter sp. Uisw_099_02 TaxID=3230981 RepID=UPI0039ED5166
MRILHITKYFNNFGGIETLTRSICNQLSKKYKKIDILSFSPHNKKNQYIKNKYKIINCTSNFVLSSTPFSLSMFCFLKNNINKYDIVHITVPNPWPTILIALFSKKINLLYISWGSDIIKQKLLKVIFNFFQKKLLKKAKRIICLSQNYVNYSQDLKNFKNKILIVPPIIKSVKRNIKINSKEIRILSVGRLVSYKGYKCLIEAASILPKNYTFNLVGDGPEKEMLERDVKKYKLSDRFFIHTKASEDKKNSLLKNSDIFCFTSNTRAESFGISLLEAINHSLPVIVSDNKGSGMQDMIINGYNGYNFKNNSSKDLKNKILKATQNKKKILTFSKNSKKLFNIKFNNTKIRNKIFEIYEGAI